MKINLEEDEIKQALIEFINNKGVPLTGTQTEVTLIAGRGANGHSAVIEILPVADPNQEAPTPKPEGNQQAIKFDFSSDDDD